jgi:Pyrrolidone-carboxylate peptidase (N-terminal pyroglutamyl peptidase)
MGKILLAGFEGDSNSSKILLDNLSTTPNIDKLYLQNNFENCALQIKNSISKNKYKFIIAFGQKPVIKSIYIERCANVNGQKHETIFQYKSFERLLSAKGYTVKLSDNAGDFLCNHVYGMGLSFIEQQRTAVMYLFVHIPQLKNLSGIDMLATTIDEYIKQFI